MTKNGFTLIELLVVSVILGIILGVAIPSFNKYIFNTEDIYYEDLENSIRSTVMDYMADNRNLLPLEVDTTTVVDEEKLIDNNYIENIVDSSGRRCDVQINVKKISDSKYDYVVCLSCPEYKTDDSQCQY